MYTKEAIYKVLDLLEVKYATEVPAQVTKAIDDVHLATYQVDHLDRYVSAVAVIDIYTKIVWNWVWNGGPVTNSDWGIISDTEFIPLTIINPLQGSEIKFTYKGVVLSPENAYGITNDYFTDVCMSIYEKLDKNYDAIVSTILQADASVTIRNDLLDTFIKSHKILKDIGGQIYG